mmetsp:Transcript_38444/g.105905  ORF Transcript_38444/g.105905 Transcript_38444/m.105905 type:complete len:337 (-) Transcript_38444:115-1125(-)
MSQSTAELLLSHVVQNARPLATAAPWAVSFLVVLLSAIRRRSDGGFGAIFLAYLAGICTGPTADLLFIFRLRCRAWLESQLVQEVGRVLEEAPVSGQASMKTSLLVAEASRYKRSQANMTVTKLTAVDRKQIDTFLSLVADTNWKRIDTKEGTDRFTMQLPGSPLHLVKGSTVIHADLAVCKDFMTDHDKFEVVMKAADEMNYERRIVETIDDNHAVFYGAFRVPGILWNRDIVWSGMWALLQDQELIVLGTSTERADVPERTSERLVRADMCCSGYRLKVRAPGEIVVDYVVQVDPKGYVPKWVVNIVSADQAHNVTRLRKFFEAMQKKDVALST